MNDKPLYKSMSILLLCIAICHSASGQTKPETQGMSCTISISNSNSSNSYSGHITAVVVNHEEQYSFKEELNRHGEFSFISPIAVNKSLNNFLSEEEYFNLITVKTNTEKIELQQVKKKSLRILKDQLHCTLIFKAAR